MLPSLTNFHLHRAFDKQLKGNNSFHLRGFIVVPQVLTCVSLKFWNYLYQPLHMNLLKLLGLQKGWKAWINLQRHFIYVKNNPILEWLTFQLTWKQHWVLQVSVYASDLSNRLEEPGNSAMTQTHIEMDFHLEGTDYFHNQCWKSVAFQLEFLHSATVNVIQIENKEVWCFQAFTDKK